jgi:hypothetical protein
MTGGAALSRDDRARAVLLEVLGPTPENVYYLSRRRRLWPAWVSLVEPEAPDVLQMLAALVVAAAR